jgi:hypothetical protein
MPHTGDKDELLLGSLTLLNGDEYVGQWKDGQRHGKGLYVSTRDGFRYNGEWLTDKPDGQGTLTLASGDRYDGWWRQGQRHGISVR